MNCNFDLVRVEYRTPVPGEYPGTLGPRSILHTLPVANGTDCPRTSLNQGPARRSAHRTPRRPGSLPTPAYLGLGVDRCFRLSRWHRPPGYQPLMRGRKQPSERRYLTVRNPIGIPLGFPNDRMSRYSLQFYNCCLCGNRENDMNRRRHLRLPDSSLCYFSALMESATLWKVDATEAALRAEVGLRSGTAPKYGGL